METYISGYDAQGLPIYSEELSPEETIARFKESDEYKTFTQKFDTANPGNQTLLQMLFVDKLGDDPSVDDFRRLIQAVVRSGGVVSLRTIKSPSGEVLLNAGQYEFELRQAEPEQQPEPEVPRDKNGKPLSQSQIAWGEMARWSQTASSQEIRERRRTDPAFASFYRLNIERETRETESTQFQLAGQPQTKSKQATPELVAWAQEYRKTPVEKVRQLRSPAFNALGYRDYIKTEEAALAAGLI